MPRKPPLKHTPRPRPLPLAEAQLEVDLDGDGLTIALRPKDGGRILQMPKPKRPHAT